MCCGRSIFTLTLFYDLKLLIYPHTILLLEPTPKRFTVKNKIKNIQGEKCHEETQHDKNMSNKATT